MTQQLKTYPISEYGEYLKSLPTTRTNVKWPFSVKAVKIGEFRSPKKGEWYISGAIPGAWKALNDLDIPYQIAKLVLVREEIITTVIGDYIEKS